VQKRVALVPLDVADRVQREEVPDLGPAHVLVEEGLDALDERAPLLGIALADQLGQQPLFLLVAPLGIKIPRRTTPSGEA
jgi:hypothetical protein